MSGIGTLAPLVGPRERGLRAAQTGSRTIDLRGGGGLGLPRLGPRGRRGLDPFLGVGDAPVTRHVGFSHAAMIARRPNAVAPKCRWRAPRARCRSKRLSLRRVRVGPD